MIDTKDLENAEAVELKLEEKSEAIGGRYAATTGSGEKPYSTVTDYIYQAAWRVFWY